MANYALVSDLLDFLEDFPEIAPPAAPAAERLLRRAERDLEAHVLRWPAPVAAGPRVDVGSLTGYEVAALRAATVAQAAFRLVRTESELLEGPDGIAGVGNVSFSLTTPPAISPEALVALSGVGSHLIRRSGTLQAPAPPAA